MSKLALVCRDRKHAVDLESMKVAQELITVIDKWVQRMLIRRHIMSFYIHLVRKSYIDYEILTLNFFYDIQLYDSVFVQK